MVKIALFQSNTGIDPAANAARLVEAIGRAADAGAAMLFTPEMSGLLDRDPERAAHNVRLEENDEVLAAAREAAREKEIWVHIGSLAVRTEGRQLANRAFVIDPRGEVRARYDKIHLVPFGEYVPFKALLGFARQLTAEVGDFIPGARRTVFDMGRYRLGVFICYESIFPDEVRQFAANGAQVFVNISNDEWFGQSGAPGQHLNQARMRAIENNRWVLRDTNTGITASIDPFGRVVESAPRNVMTTLDAPFSVVTRTTFYTRHGDWFAWLCAIISTSTITAGLVFKRWRHNR
jgi:apolipoprotein N-acyltransferase